MTAQATQKANKPSSVADSTAVSLLTATTSANDQSLDIEDTKLGWFVLLVVCASAVGGFMFGYDTACISSILLFLDKPGSLISMNNEEKELVTGITSVGSFFGSLVSSWIADKYGRKHLISLCCVVFVLAAVQLGMCNSVHAMAAGRLVVGVAVGAASTVVPVYISEVAPSRKRGTLLVLNSITTTGGQFIANLLALIIAPLASNWRIMYFLSGIPPLLFLLVVGFIPQSPRFSILQGDIQDAERSIAKLYPYSTPGQVQVKISEILADIEINEVQHKSSLYQRLFGSRATRRALFVGCGLMFFQQASSFNSFMYYGATIFHTVGVGNPLVVSILISGTNFLFTFVALRFIDSVGRRNMLLRTVWIMAVALFIAGMAFNKYDVKLQASNADLNASVLVLSVLTFVAGYASALGTVPWLSVEFLPLEARASGSSVIAAIGWVTNFLVSAFYLTLVDSTSLSITSIIFTALCVLGWAGIYRWYPEVKGMALEDVQAVFESL